ncbi:hypothetical protein G3569_04105 [Aliifodinibius halophilus]|uniref:Uncharacterized protein n=2 Tax=Fodinibius halophilus TaxID=1736908 RepID=A0A6M1T0L9_9BACT|nr:hypothetical protein [Fodinibius halophilus]
MFLGLSGCENPGSLDRNIGDNRAEVVVDTLAIGDVSTHSFNFYSGGFQFISAGEFEDPLLGTLKATGLIKPALPSGSEDTLTNDSEMMLRFKLDGGMAYGDSLAEQRFDVYEIDEVWRTESIKLQDDIVLDTEGGPLTSFPIGSTDSLDVPLPGEWVEKYRAFADTADADSVYARSAFGLALVPSNSKKIIAPNVVNTKFVIQNPVEEDTFAVGLNEWAYLLERNEKSLPSGLAAWHSTKEQILSFDFDFSSLDVEGTDISRAELVFYQDTELMDQSLESQSSGVKRPKAKVAQLHLVDPDQLPANIAPGDPLANGFYSTDDDAFHFEVTPQVQRILAGDLAENKKFVITLNNTGLIKTSIIHTSTASTDKQPKLIITSLKNNNK